MATPDVTLINAASRSRRRISQVMETVRGTTPTDPGWRELGILDSSAMDQTQTYERSGEVKSNRMGGKQVGGNIQAAGTLSLPSKYDQGVIDLFSSAFSCEFVHPTVTGAGSHLAFVSNGTKADFEIVFSANPQENDSLTLNGVEYTFKATPVFTNDVDIGATLPDTLDNLLAKVNASTDSRLTVATYSEDGTDTFSGLYKTFGTVGNAYTIVWDFAATTLAVNGEAAAISGSETMVNGAGTADSITDAESRLQTLGFHAGMIVTITNSTTPANNGSFKVLSVAADGSSMTIDHEVTAEAIPTNGNITAATSWYGLAGTVRKFFTHEVAYLDVTPVVFEYFRGMEVNTLTLNVPTSGEITSEMAMVGISGEITNEEFIGAGTRTAAASVAPFAGSVTGSRLDRGGEFSPEIETLTISVNNNRAAKFAVGQAYAALVDEGDFDVEMTFGLYFTDLSVQQQYLAGTRTSLELQAVDQEVGNILAIELPNIVFTAAPRGLSGNTVIQNMTAFAEESSTYGSKARVWFIPPA